MTGTVCQPGEQALSFSPRFISEKKTKNNSPMVFSCMGFHDFTRMSCAAMHSFSVLSARAVVSAFDFSKSRSLVLVVFSSNKELLVQSFV